MSLRKLRRAARAASLLVLAAALPLMIDYTADWCTACRYMEPALEAARTAWADQIEFQTVDLTDSVYTADEAPVRVVPTQAFFYADGTPYEPSDALKAVISFAQVRDAVTGELRYTLHEGGLTQQGLDAILSELTQSAFSTVDK